jgi:hypothetical protein
VLGLEVSRLARNNAEWYRLLDLRDATDTLIGDGDGVYHPGLFNDLLGRELWRCTGPVIVHEDPDDELKVPV